ncbi:hypothetical protein RTG05_07795 [Geodermatophilus sp. DSM 44513]|nr:hypothetical protein [Geodermatophilus sp. DSM 44513]WNV77166.1 hypothetical protein RTG05_07795 [Geodermatophilus sp. DSM 44513]
MRDFLAAINGIGHAAVACDPQFGAALVDLQVQMPVGIAGAGGVMPHRDGLSWEQARSSRLPVLMTFSWAMHRLPSVGPLRHGGVDVGRLPDDEAATVGQGVPVVLPVREGSPGGSCGTAASWPTS